MENIKPSCWHCKNGIFHRGHSGTRYEPPVSDEIECIKPLDDSLYEKIELAIETANKLSDRSVDEYEMYAHHCGNFEPIMAEKCYTCGKEINAPMYTWPIKFMGIYGDVPVPCCSDDCKQVLVDQDKKAMEEESEYLASIEWGG